MAEKKKVGVSYKIRTIYRFDLEGKQTGVYETIGAAAKANKTDDSNIRQALTREDCFRRKCYFSYDENFVIPIKNRSSNILHARTGRLMYGSDLFLKEFSDDEEDD